jgi:hypothetical protein
MPLTSAQCDRKDCDYEFGGRRFVVGTVAFLAWVSQGKFEGRWLAIWLIIMTRTGKNYERE